MIWVTGATGDLGRGLCQKLKERGHVLSNAKRCDVTNFSQVLENFKARLETEGPPSALFHCAVFVELSKTENDPSHTCAVNELGAIHVLEALKELGLKPWTCMVSSGHSYAPVEKPKLLSEKSAVNPRSFYALSKLNAERWAQLMGDRAQIPIFIPRVFSFTAPWQRTSFVVPRLASQIKAAQSGAQLAMGWLGAFRDFLDIRDAAEALVLAFEKRVTGTYNVCRGEPFEIRSIRDYFQSLWQELHTPDARLNFSEGKPRLDDVEWLIGDPSKFSLATGFAPRIPWSNTLQEIWRAH